MMKGWFILGILYRVEPLVGPPVGTVSTTHPAPQDSGTCSAALNRMCLSYLAMSWRGAWTKSVKYIGWWWN